MTKNYYQTRKSFKRAIGHAISIEEVEMFVEVNNHIAEMTFVRVSPLGENKNLSNPKDIANLQKKIERGVTSYNIYELNFREDIWIIKTEAYKNHSETVYTLYKKE